MKIIFCSLFNEIYLNFDFRALTKSKQQQETQKISEHYLI